MFKTLLVSLIINATALAPFQSVPAHASGVEIENILNNRLVEGSEKLEHALKKIFVSYPVAGGKLVWKNVKGAGKELKTGVVYFAKGTGDVIEDIFEAAECVGKKVEAGVFFVTRKVGSELKVFALEVKEDGLWVAKVTKQGVVWLADKTGKAVKAIYRGSVYVAVQVKNRVVWLACEGRTVAIEAAEKIKAGAIYVATETAEGIKFVAVNVAKGSTEVVRGTVYLAKKVGQGAVMLVRLAKTAAVDVAIATASGVVWLANETGEVICAIAGGVVVGVEKIGSATEKSVVYLARETGKGARYLTVKTVAGVKYYVESFEN